MNPEILITGLGHSGTTYIASLLEACGYDLGSPFQQPSTERNGKEWQPFSEILECGNRGGDLSGLAKLNYPRAVKSPAFMGCSEYALPLINPGAIVFVYRPLREWAESLQFSSLVGHREDTEALMRSGQASIDILKQTAITRQTPMYTVEYPLAAQDSFYAHDALYSVTQMDYEAFFGTWTRITRPEYIGYSARVYG